MARSPVMEGLRNSQKSPEKHHDTFNNKRGERDVWYLRGGIREGGGAWGVRHKKAEEGEKGGPDRGGEAGFGGGLRILILSGE